MVSGDGGREKDETKDSGSRGRSSSLDDQQEVTAPSVGPNTVIEKEDPEERLARHEQSDTDAMGLDKRREVVGQSYGPSFARQAALYGIFVAVTAALVIGFVLLAGKLDAGARELRGPGAVVASPTPSRPSPNRSNNAASAAPAEAADRRLERLTPTVPIARGPPPAARPESASARPRSRTIRSPRSRCASGTDPARS